MLQLSDLGGGAVEDVAGADSRARELVA
jgi:hypothetical protein